MQAVDSFQYKLTKGGTQTTEESTVVEVSKRVKNKQSEIVIDTDSDYVYKGTTVYLLWWATMHIVGTDGSEIKHKVLWQQMEELATKFENMRIVIIKSHKGKGSLQWENEEADKLAKEAAITGILWEILHR
ncbi:ribonuclease H-like [Emydura macquarii macquarii]|uniref:ribonuclease H-like n=1 Tax=Emydura macquarii macquarii TaxID=1129001 RepID=UPI00352AABD3